MDTVSGYIHRRLGGDERDRSLVSSFGLGRWKGTCRANPGVECGACLVDHLLLILCFLFCWDFFFLLYFVLLPGN